MPGGWLGLNEVTRESQGITSWRSSEDPSPGRYHARIGSDGYEQLLIVLFSDDSWWDWSIYPPNGHRRYVSGSKTNLFFADFNKLIHLTNTTDLSVFTYILMEPSGLFRQMIWLNNSQQWISLYSQPEDQCMVNLFCGSSSLCDRKSSPVCSCFPGFKPASMKDWELGVWQSGCTRKTGSKCDNNDPYGFFKMGMVELPPDSLKVDEVHSDEECEKTCQRDCFCTAYAFDEQCSIWIGDLPGIKQLYDGDLSARTLNIHLVASDIPSPTSSSSHTPGQGLTTAVISSVVAGVIVIICLAYAGLTRFRVSRRSTLVEMHAEGFLISFTYADLQRMTKNFSDIMGRGGFGSVFKGALPDSTIIAVKKLEGLRQGEKQFRAEVSTLGSIQHVNLVHLKGFCCEGKKRLLVYDYMSGGSLDSHLFRNKQVLDWETRFKIIIGVARALAYVHEKCRECIIHCDIKPENILLDREFSPKVADFGMAKLTSHDFSKVLTTMRGTLGYLAPEWISGLPITPKVDVYSFGMLLFEVVSGERNWQNSMYSENDGENCYFPIRAATQLLQGNVSDLLDKRLQGEADLEEVEKVCRVACWCIQDSDAHRPTMGQVVQILEGVLEIGTPPVPWFLQNLINSPSSISCNLPQNGDKDVESQGSFVLQPGINCS
ncbi:Non-specific serine/threonine protein kinase protein [Dioscorea alata]|uniref:Non-specific serine/threonine protein kinase protein n=1 Tax=Dioscorea alata TaxID=55571 RepID=A0ACB7W1U3_DIOAL|nr:Non-specific serine/threonine protein kinase protein [Dioscorea alata]